VIAAVAVTRRKENIAIMNANIRSRRRNSVVAGIGAIVLLLGGTTFALWSAVGSQATGNITTGNLDIAVTDVQWYDISSDRTDNSTVALSSATAHPIASMADYRIVPGDTIEGDAKFGIALEGDNMVAELELGFSNITDANSLLSSGALVLSYKVCAVSSGTLVDDCANPLLEVEDIKTTAGSAGTLLFQASGTGQASGSPDVTVSGGVTSAIPTATYSVLPTNATGGPDPSQFNFAVIITATFNNLDTTPPANDYTKAQAVLNDLTVSLTQTRTAGEGNFQDVD
jgi:alternate signal-mediated exported protein